MHYSMIYINIDQLTEQIYQHKSKYVEFIHEIINLSLKDLNN